MAEHHVATLAGHTQEVCGLKWSLDGRYLASGGNDNLVNIWPCTQGDSGDFAPVQTFSQHQGAVKVSAGLLWACVCVQGRHAALAVHRLLLACLRINPFLSGCGMVSVAVKCSSHWRWD